MGIQIPLYWLKWSKPFEIWKMNHTIRTTPSVLFISGFYWEHLTARTVMSSHILVSPFLTTAYLTKKCRERLGGRFSQLFIPILQRIDLSCVRSFWILTLQQDVGGESCELFLSGFVLSCLQAEFMRKHWWECSHCSSHRSEKAVGEENKNNHNWFPKMTNPAAPV